jgi:hypothetical protein
LYTMKALLSQTQRIWWGQLAFDYYLGGRILILNQQYHTGFILLSYAIEVHFKQAMAEKGISKLKRSHELRKLYSECLSNGLFRDVEIPSDFLEYAEYLLHSRYPSQTQKSLSSLNRQNRTMNLETAIMFCYDEVVVCLERSLYGLTSDYTSSVFFRLFVNINKDSNRQGLYYNGAALKNFEIYRDLVLNNASSNSEAIQLLNTKPKSFFWSPEGKQPFARYDLNLSKDRLSRFILPGNIERDETGKATIIQFGSPFRR